MDNCGPLLCRLRELPDGTSRGFSVATPSGSLELFVVSKDGGIFAYRNSCPHTGAPLDWLPDRFLTMDGTMIQCATHDARFRIRDGLCVAGPCAGRRLQRLATVTEQDDLFLDLSADVASGLSQKHP
jgi:nitrite reductase/ring-hydroxylating ferredoxin subunit